MGKTILRIILWLFFYPFLILIGLLSYPIAKLIPKYKPYCPDTFRQYLKELWWGIKTDWRE